MIKSEHISNQSQNEDAEEIAAIVRMLDFAQDRLAPSDPVGAYLVEMVKRYLSDHDSDVPALHMRH